MRTKVFAIAAVAALVMVSEVASAADSCNQSYEQAQYAKRDKKYRNARKSLLLCSQSNCSGAVVNDCVQWLSDIERAMPSMVFGAEDGTGHEITDVKVFFDNEPLVQKLDGSAVSVDPGEHVFRFEREGAKPVEQKLLVREGDKSRNLNVKLPGTKDIAVVATPGKPPTGNENTVPATGARPAGSLAPTIIFASVGGAAFIATAILGASVLSGKSDCQTQQDAGNPCSQSDIDSLKTRRTITDVALGVGIVSVGVATVLFFTRDKGEEAPATKSAYVKPVLSPSSNGGYVGLVGAF